MAPPLILALFLLSLSPPHSHSHSSPLSPKSSLLRYWSRKIPNSQPCPSFFTSKLSPLSPLDLASFSSLSPSQFSSRLPSFCAAAHLLCSNHHEQSNKPFPGYSSWSFRYKTNKNSTTVPRLGGVKAKMTSGSSRVPPGLFFRERELKKGTVMLMPDITDKVPPRSFLPRAIASRIPFSASEVKEIFQISSDDSAMGKAIDSTLGDCKRAPSRGEKKRCPTSAEDMIDFAVSVLGPNVVVRGIENTNGSSGEIMIGDVKGINGGKVTQSVSCHQPPFPYLVYYCHSVPKVRVYEFDILAIDTKEKINHGVAICHLDTSDWSAGNPAFVALGSTPGQIEVCHWMFEGDMIWAVAD